MATAVNATYQLERVVPLNRKVSGEPLYVHLVRHNYDLKWIADDSPCLTGESVLLVHLDARTADWFGLEELLGPDLLAGGLWYHKTARTWNVTCYTNREAFLADGYPAGYAPTARNR